MQPLDPLTLPLEGCRLLEASAGTGKTYTLALLYLRLLVERGLAVDRILVVTFTRAAAGELRDRIRSRVREALNHLQGRPSPDPLLARLLAGSDPDAGRQRLGDALVRMDEAIISTIHGFCQRILVEHAFEAAIPFQMELIEGEAGLTRQVIEDFWRLRFYPADTDQATWAAATWKNPDGLLAAIQPALHSPHCRLLPAIDPDQEPILCQRCHASLTLLRERWPLMREEVQGILMEDDCLLRNEKAYRLIDQVPRLLLAMDSLAAGDGLPASLPEGIELLAASTMAGQLKKKCTHPPGHPFFVLFEQFQMAHTLLLRHRTQAVLAGAVAYVRDQRHLRTFRQARFTFDALLTRLSAALGRPGTGALLAARLAERFPAILVDEFQDTDPIQDQIFSRIQAAGDSSLFMIGDPKQAIYSFRGGDIFTYIGARRRTDEANRATLAVNYRSTPAMVSAVNRLFSLIPDAFVFAADIPFTPVTAAASGLAGHLVVDGREMPPLTCLHLDSRVLGPGSSRPISKAEAGQAAVRFTSQVLVELLEQASHGAARLGNRPLTTGDIAILVRNHRQATAMQAELRRRGIASLYLSQDSVFASPEAGQLALVLTTLADPGDPSLVRASLAGELFGLDGEQILALAGDEPAWNRRLTDLGRYQQIWREEGLLPMLQHLLTAEQVTRRLTGRIGGERSLTNYLHLAELLQASPAARYGMAALLRWFRHQMENPNKESDEQLTRLESEGGLVRILTIHRAKGLEFPVVLLPFLWAGGPGDNHRVRTFHDRTTLEMSVEFGPGEEQHLTWATEERLAEELRLFYVAVTRAKSTVIFPWGRVRGLEGSAGGRLLHGGALPVDDAALLADLNRLNALEPLLSFRPWPERIASHRLAAREEERPLVPRIFAGRVEPGWMITSYSRLVAEAESPAEDEPGERAVGPAPAGEDFTSVFTFPRGPAAGTCLHNLLERLDFSRPAGDQLAMVAESLEQGGVDSRWQGAVVRWLDALTSVELPGACPLAGISARERITELGFLFPVNRMDLGRFNQLLAGAGFPTLPGSGRLQALMKGFIDLVFCHQGRYFIVDYKSNYLGPTVADYRPDTLEACMTSHQYHLQALIYTLALHRYLGKRLADYDYNHHFGGCRYLFLRAMHPDHPPGTGIHALRPDQKLIEAVDRSLRGDDSGGRP